MTQISKQWFARALSLCVVGPMCAMIASGVNAPDGSGHTTFLTGDSVATGGVSLLVVLALTVVTGVAIGRLVDRREGILNISFILGWVAWTSGRLGEVYRVAPETGTIAKLAVEAVLVGVFVVLALVLMSDPKKGSVHGHSDEVSRFDIGYIKDSIASSVGLITIISALIGSLVISMLFGQTDLPGQSVGVAFGAGIFGGLAGAMAANSMRKSDEKQEPTPFAPLMIGVMLCGVFGPMIGLVKPGSSGLLELVTHGDLPGYLIVSPMAWSMGALLGVPIGHSWVEHSVHHSSGAAAKSA